MPVGPYPPSPCFLLKKTTSTHARHLEDARLQQEMQVMEGRMLREVRKVNLKDRTDHAAISIFFFTLASLA
jgi:hypothetical protein